MATAVEQWVEEVARWTQPERVVWCEGSEAELQALAEQMVAEGSFIRLNPTSFPNCYLHRSHPDDVARTEKVTFICTRRREDAGPTNNWMDPQEARQRVGELFRGAMRGRTMYVVPYILGPADSPYSRLGVELTDSRYVVASMAIMTRLGRLARQRLENGEEFVPGLHSLGELNPRRRYILHFPEEKLIWSIGSGYGGNALLAKKCFGLRIASWLARQQGWMAEHMLILGLEDPTGRVTYMAAAFPSACGKTNTAMMVSALVEQGYRVWTVGDDIAWLHPGPDGYLYAINPEAGFFGVAPGTNPQTNPNIMAALRQNSIFTNVALTPAQEPWWEGLTPEPPAGLLDWRGRRWAPPAPAAHPNSRYTVPARQLPSLSPHWEHPTGVPISAFIFGGRRARVAPLVYETLDWEHGVFAAASLASETTAAATGAVGVVRRDPMAMLPFCGYNMADYFAHWLEMGRRLRHPPRIFCVNWFRKDASGHYLWPGFGENVRILKWILERLDGTAKAEETPIGLVPTPDSITLDGLALPTERLREALRVDANDWLPELESIAQFFQQFGDRLPKALWHQHAQLLQRLQRVGVPAP